MEILSEKEIIDIIKDFLELREIYSSDNMRKSFLSIYKDAIQGLLDLYQKEKEKNKELENADLTTVYMNGFYDGEKKWKDKIKEKIEELDKKEKKELKGTKGQDRYNIKQEFMFKKNILQELLEGRN